MSLHLHELEVVHAGRTLVEVADIEAVPGRAVTIVGESGSGKSLLAHALMGTLDPGLGVRGSMSLGGVHHDLADRTGRRRLWGRRLAMLPQEPGLALDPTMRVGAQVAEGAGVAGASRRTALLEADRALADVGLPGHARAYPHTLSGGMAQRVAFAAATIGGADLLIADEPSKGLDPEARTALADLLHRHLARGGLLLTITHDLDLARALGGDVLVMKQANVVERGPAQHTLVEPEHPYSRRLLDAEPARWSYPWQRSGGVGDDAAPLVEATGVGKAFGPRRLFSDLSLTVRAGERVALTGPSGIGKSTLGDVLLRLARPDTGSVRHAAAAGRGLVQKLYQDPAASFPAQVSTGVGVADLLRRHRLSRGRLEELLDELHLPEGVLERRPGQVSGGELQRLALVRAMLLDPVLLLADEPTSRLDLVTQQDTMHRLLQQLDAQGCALVLISHDPALSGAVADREVRLG